MSSSPTKRSRKSAEVVAPSAGGTAGSAPGADAATPGAAARNRRRPDSLEMRANLERILAGFTAAHVVIDGDYTIMQFHGNAGRYLELAPGGPKLNLFTMLRPGLLVPMRTALTAACEHRAPVRKRDVKVQTNSGLESVDIEVIPVLSDAREKKNWFVVVFEPADPEPAPRRRSQQTAVAPAQAPRAGSQILQLREELGQLRESLRMAAIQQELTNGELQSANAEVQSANEELQSIIEELETSREQLQSSNDQLMTVNQSLLERTAALEASISEVNSLLASVQVAALVVDRELRIKSFTVAAEDRLNVIRGDVGRPLRDLNLSGLCPNLEAQLQEVLMTGSAKTLIAHDKSGHRCRLRLSPYVTERNIEGVTIVADAGQQEQLTG